MPDRLRRLGFDERGWNRRLGGDSLFTSNRVHPFRFIHEPRGGPKIRICLQSTWLDSGSEESGTALRLLSELRPEHYEVFRTPGDTDTALTNVPAFHLDDGLDVAEVSLTAWGRVRGSAVHYPRQWGDLAELWVGDRSVGGQLIEVKAAEALGAPLFISVSPTLLHVRELRRFRTSIVTPLEALPILWSWTRGFGDYWDGHTVTSAQFYYWALARALTPNATPGFAALVRAEYRLPAGEELVTLGQSVLVRLASAIHGIWE